MHPFINYYLILNLEESISRNCISQNRDQQCLPLIDSYQDPPPNKDDLENTCFILKYQYTLKGSLKNKVLISGLQ